MRFVIDISEYDKEWIGNVYGIPQDINTKIAEAIINAELCQPELHYDEWCDSCQEYDHNKHCCPRWNKVIKNTVEELKVAQSEPPWIPVTERLPKIGEYVFCEMATRHFGIYSKYHVCKFVDKDKWVDKPHFDWDRNGFPNVIAWMPLPKSYKGVTT